MYKKVYIFILQKELNYPGHKFSEVHRDYLNDYRPLAHSGKISLKSGINKFSTEKKAFNDLEAIFYSK